MKLKIYYDEAGRWPLAWPVVVGLTLPLGSFDTSVFDDSKKLSEKKKDKLFEHIEQLEKEGKMLHSFGFATNQEIDKLWIVQSINIAVKRWMIVLIKKFIDTQKKNIHWNGDKLLNIEKLNSLIFPIFDYIENINNYDFKEIISVLSRIEKLHWILFDGNSDFHLSDDFGFKIITVIKWDGKIPYIWAASVVAKVIRDNYMKEIAMKYPKYNFEKHKWYGTKLHRELIQKYWPSPIHRISFLNNILDV